MCIRDRLWEVSDCTEPANVGGVYQITKETELHWFASEVNSGNTAISARLLNDLALTSGNWYPIGKTGHAYTCLLYTSYQKRRNTVCISRF